MAVDEGEALRALLVTFDQCEVAGDVSLAIFHAVDAAMAEQRQAAPRSPVAPMWFDSLGRMIDGDELFHCR